MTGPEPVGSSDSTPLPSDGPASGEAWDPDGTDLARALLGRAGGGGRAGSGQPAQRLDARGDRRRRWSPGAGWSGPNRDERDPQRLETAVERLVGEHGWGRDLAVHGVVARWDQIVGADIASHVRPESYADGEVTVRADSTAWATQVKLLAPNLVRRLNEEIGDSTVTRVNVLGPHAPTWRKGRRSVPGRGPRDTYG
jgi:predicted nucleic acid-binding Zn ribbon protein